MTITLRLFARASELVGQSELELELAVQSTVGNLRAQLGRQFPQLAPTLPHLLFAVDNDYVPDAFVLNDGASVVAFPPVSGG
ncbi:MAG: MoaD/ThiS family protein [Planctomycetaceae bacterium]|nr:MoaD/ThiS family protein [Planctomycetaceae bacterium]